MPPSNVLTMILAGGGGTRLLPLTRDRSKPAVAFAGSLRVIDFTLFNCAASGLDSVYVLTQYKAESLHTHLSARWGCVPGPQSGFVRALPSVALEAGGMGYYTGTADAVLKNLALLARHLPEVVLVLSGDHVYRADYRGLIDAHFSRRAEVTILTDDVSCAAASAFGVLEVAPDGRVVRFVEKPRDPLPYARGGRCRINLGIYCFDPRFLEELLLADAWEPRSSHDFGKDVLPGALAGGRVLSFPLALASTGRRPYWRDVGTIESYFEANMDLLRSPAPFCLEDALSLPGSPFGGWIPQRHAAVPRFAKATSGQNLLAHDMQTEGGRLVSCVISPGVRIEPGADLEECVLLPGCVVGEGSRLRRAIVDEGAHVPPGMRIDERSGPCAVRHGGINVVCEEAAKGPRAGPTVCSTLVEAARGGR